MKSNFEIFLNAYLTCLVWSSSATDEDEQYHEILDSFELSKEAKENAKEDCARFMKENSYLLSQAYKNQDGFASAGHDFWLTRNCHGSGFWDRGLGFIGDALTDRAREFKEKHVYIDADLLYIE